MQEPAKELTIKALTELVAKVVGFTGEIKWDTSRPERNTPKAFGCIESNGFGGGLTKLNWKMVSDWLMMISCIIPCVQKGNDLKHYLCKFFYYPEALGNVFGLYQITVVPNSL